MLSSSVQCLSFVNLPTLRCLKCQYNISKDGAKGELFSSLWSFSASHIVICKGGGVHLDCLKPPPFGQVIKWKTNPIHMNNSGMVSLSRNKKWAVKVAVQMHDFQVVSITRVVVVYFCLRGTLDS